MEYVFPLTEKHTWDCHQTPCASGAAVTTPIEMVHFMLEGSGGDCTASAIDDIVIRRHKKGEAQAFCTKGTSRECIVRNGEGGTPWDMCGAKSVQDTGATKESDCQGFCDAETGFDCTGFGFMMDPVRRPGQRPHACPPWWAAG